MMKKFNRSKILALTIVSLGVASQEAESRVPEMRCMESGFDLIRCTDSRRPLPWRPPGRPDNPPVDPGPTPSPGAPSPQLVLTGPASTGTIPMNFYLMCRDEKLSECSTLPQSNSANGAADVMALLNRHMNFDGTMSSLSTSTHRRGFHLGKVYKVYAPEYYQISGNIDDSAHPSGDKKLPREGRAVNVYVTASAPYCGKAIQGEVWRTTEGAGITVDQACLNAFQGQEVRTVNGKREVVEGVFGDESLAHETMHLMGSGHTADFWGGRGVVRGCARIFTYRVRKLNEQTYKEEAGRNVMSYDALGYTTSSVDENQDGLPEYSLATSFANENLNVKDMFLFKPWVTRSRSAGEMMSFARDCFLREQAVRPWR